MKTFFFNIIFVLCSFSINAQWVEQNSGVTETLRAVSFINTEKGWAAGDGGKILFTSDGGQNWVTQNSTITSGSLRNIDYRSENSVICVGNGGFIRTTNGGQTWNFFQTSGIDLKSAHYSNDTILWYGGTNKYLMRVTPSSQTNINLENPIFNWEIIDIASAGDYVFVLVLMNNSLFHLYKSNDNFNTWSKKTVGSNTLHNKTKLFLINENLGWLGGSYRFSSLIYPQIDRVVNSGDSIETIFTPGFQSGYFGVNSGLYFVNENTGFMSTTLNSGIYKTTDGGVTWGLTNGVNSRINDIYFIDENIGYAVGENGKIYKTTNGGGQITNIEKEETNPTDFILNQNFPNPFNPSTKIEYQIPFNSKVMIEIYSITGERVAELINSEMEAGFYTQEINSNTFSLASGVYIYHLTAQSINNGEQFMKVKKMVLMK